MNNRIKKGTMDKAMEALEGKKPTPTSPPIEGKPKASVIHNVVKEIEEVIRKNRLASGKMQPPAEEGDKPKTKLEEQLGLPPGFEVMSLNGEKITDAAELPPFLREKLKEITDKLAEKFSNQNKEMRDLDLFAAYMTGFTNPGEEPGAAVTRCINDPETPPHILKIAMTVKKQFKLMGEKLGIDFDNLTDEMKEKLKEIAESTGIMGSLMGNEEGEDWKKDKDDEEDDDDLPDFLK